MAKILDDSPTVQHQGSVSINGLVFSSYLHQDSPDPKICRELTSLSPADHRSSPAAYARDIGSSIWVAGEGLRVWSQCTLLSTVLLLPELVHSRSSPLPTLSKSLMLVAVVGDRRLTEHNSSSRPAADYFIRVLYLIHYIGQHYVHPVKYMTNSLVPNILFFFPIFWFSLYTVPQASVGASPPT
jgi:hypothetical protein